MNSAGTDWLGPFDTWYAGAVHMPSAADDDELASAMAGAFRASRTDSAGGLRRNGGGGGTDSPDAYSIAPVRTCLVLLHPLARAHTLPPGHWLRATQVCAQCMCFATTALSRRRRARAQTYAHVLCPTHTHSL